MTDGYLGIDVGTQGLSVIFTDTALKILATAEGSYDMVPGLGAECFEQHPADWEAALAAAMAALRQKLDAAGIIMQVISVFWASIGRVRNATKSRSGEVVRKMRL